MNLRHVFVVQHVRDDDDSSRCDTKLIGVYSSEREAKLAIDRLRRQKGFIDFPNGFSVDQYELDRDHWTEGFVLEGV
jgi:hypothetical protein